MPYLYSTPNTTTAAFTQLVTKYKRVIESNASARCMIGFTAAFLIRSEGELIDLKSVEQWLMSLNIHLGKEEEEEEEEEGNNMVVDTILNAVKCATYWTTQQSQEICTNNVEEHEK